MLAISYARKHADRFADELFDFLRIPSVSADQNFKEDVKKAARFVHQQLLSAGAEEVQLFETKGNPIVYGESIINKDAPTVLCYGHYDVQPADPYELWQTPPFEPSIRDGRVYARGATDDKGQVYMYVKALEALTKTQQLTCNVKFLIEGEEEVGSPNLLSFLREKKDLLACQSVLISDTAFVTEDTPSTTVGVRGICYAEVFVEGPKRDLHSGEYGGAVDNPIFILSRMLASLKDKQGRVAIPHFYDEVVTLSADLRATYARIPFDEQRYMSSLGVAALSGEVGYTTLERVGLRPALDVNGIRGGYIGEGAKTVLPSSAMAKVSMRLVPNQDHRLIAEHFETYMQKITPKTVKTRVVFHHGADASWLSTSSADYRVAERAVEAVWGKRPVPVHCGGSIPIVGSFKEVLGVSPILMGFGLPADGPHAPNESYSLKHYALGTETIVRFFEGITRYGV